MGQFMQNRKMVKRLTTRPDDSALLLANKCFWILHFCNLLYQSTFLVFRDLAYPLQFAWALMRE